MTIQKLLEKLKVPVERLYISRDDTTYIVWEETLETGELFSDDMEVRTGHYYMISIFSKTDYEELEKQLKELLISNDYIRKSGHDGPYNTDTGHYCRVLRFYKGE